MRIHLSFQHAFQRYRFASCILGVFLSVHFFCTGEITLGGDKQKPVNKEISLEEALTIAIKNNPQLQSARDFVDAAAGSLRQSKLYPNPVLELLAEEVPVDEIGLNESQNLVAIVQPIITGGKRKLGIEVSRKEKEKSEFDRDGVLLDVIADTKKAFYEVVADQKGLFIAREVEKIAKNIYESEGKRFDAGEVPVTNVLRAEVELSKAKNLVFRAVSNLQNSGKELLTVMGIPDETLAGVTEKLVTEPAELSLPRLESNMRNNQPLLKALKKNIEIAETQTTLEKRQVIPDIDVIAGYKRLSREEIDTVQLGIAVPVPLLNRNQGNIQRSKALLQKAKHDYESVYNNLLSQLKKNFNIYTAERKRILEYRNKILPKVEESFLLITRGYKEGEFSYIDLLDAHRTWAEMRISYIDSLKNLNLLIADLERIAVTKVQ